MPPVDRDWMIEVLLRLLQTPSPSGHTDAVMQLIGDIMHDEIGLPFRLTRRGAMVAELPGESASVDRALVVHADTIGCMVSDLKPNGRLSVIPVGTFSARFAEGARVKILTDDQQVRTGTILPLKASGHAFGDAIDSEPIGWDHVEVRVDERVSSAEELRDLGIQVGDTVALMSNPEVTRSGFIVARHLDGKAGVAAALAAAKAVAESGEALPHRTNLLVTISEEVGHGASHGLSEDVAEMISLDNAVVAPGQHSIEHGVTIPMSDMSGPFDYHLTRRLLRLAAEHEIPCARDIFRYYRSDIAAAIEAGAATRAALVAFGVDGSHGWERTEIDSIDAVARLVTAWLHTKLTFGSWDQTVTGSLREFPSAEQPVPTEKWAWLPEEGRVHHEQAHTAADLGVSGPASGARDQRSSSESSSTS